MSQLALYRKYRSQDFSELVGQDHIAQNLENALKNQRISHAYLFSGPRGVGKTSTARILARRLNNVRDTATHLDIIEIDAASNRRIDEIRDLREKIHIAPSQGKYKVYIIDEVHMLTAEAFNALLKTLEEPPAHVIFILATTEPHKLPATIISRTQRFNFKPVTPQDVIKHLRHIAQQEKIKVSDGALEIIARSGNGSFRDSISILDQAANINEDEITAETINQLLGLPPKEMMDRLITSLTSRDTKQVLELYDKLLITGTSPQQLQQQLLKTCRDWLRAKVSGGVKADVAFTQDELLLIMQSLSELSPQLGHLEVALEAVLVKLSLPYDQETSQTNTAPASAPPPSPHKKAAEPKKSTFSSSADAKPSRPIKEAAPAEFSQEAWAKALALIKSKHNSLYSVLCMAEPKFIDGILELGFRFQFHRRRLEEIKNIQVVEAALAKVCHSTIPTKATLLEPSVVVKPNEPEADVAAVMQILGGEVVG